MRTEELFDAIGMVEDEMVQKAQKIKKKFWMKKSFYGAVAAVLIVAFGVGILWKSRTPDSLLKAYAMAEANYPQMHKMPSEDAYIDNWDAYEAAHDAWMKDKETQRSYADESIDLTSFFEKSIKEFLSRKDGENMVFSPLNLYMALAMLAETTDGESREQILSLLDTKDINQLRKDVVALWNSNYSDDDAITCILANSLWLNETVKFNQSTMNRLADTYYASSYRGDPAKEEFNQVLRDWLNEQTGGLLEEMIEDVSMGEMTVLALASTVYFKARWQNEFQTYNTESDTFYTNNGELTCDFMKESSSNNYYWGEHFSATQKYFHGYRGTSSMWFILPDEGISPEELLSDTETMEFLLSGRDWENKTELTVNLSVPKFDVQSQINLTEGLKNLGITDVFDSKIADFTPVTDETICMTGATHGARVTIDEEGCTAAAFTLMLMGGGSMQPLEEVDFVLNRPFLFVITSETGLPLFTGIVNQPTG